MRSVIAAIAFLIMSLVAAGLIGPGGLRRIFLVFAPAGKTTTARVQLQAALPAAANRMIGEESDAS